MRPGSAKLVAAGAERRAVTLQFMFGICLKMLNSYLTPTVPPLVLGDGPRRRALTSVLAACERECAEESGQADVLKHLKTLKREIKCRDSELLRNSGWSARTTRS